MSDAVYRFSLRFRLPKYGVIGDPPADFVVYERDEVCVRLRTSGRVGESTLESPRDSDLVPYTLDGGPYRTETEAASDGMHWKGALLTWAASRRTPLDFYFGTSSIPSVERVDEHFLNVLLQVFPNARTRVEEFTGPIKSYFDLGLIDDKAVLAMELYVASFFDSSALSRFVTRVTAIEALIKEPASSTQMVAAVTQLLGIVRTLTIEDWEKQQLSNVLGNQKKQSITKAGAALVEALLPDHLYDGVPASRLFEDMYKTRSKIVHTGRHKMRERDFTVLSEQCGLLVSDVLTAYAGSKRTVNCSDS